MLLSRLEYPTFILALYNKVYNNVYAEFDLEKTTMKAQMKNADRLQATHCIIIGENEIKEGILTIKDMATGEQTNLPIEKVNELI